MGEFVEECHGARLVFVQISVVASHGACGGLAEKGVAHGYCRTFGVCVRFVAWLGGLLAFGVFGSADVIDCDGVVLIAAERDEFGEEIVVVLVGMIFALVFTRNEELIVIVVFVYWGFGFGGDTLASTVLRQDSLVVRVIYVRALNKFTSDQGPRRGVTGGY